MRNKFYRLALSLCLVLSPFLVVQAQANEEAERAALYELMSEYVDLSMQRLAAQINESEELATIDSAISQNRTDTANALNNLSQAPEGGLLGSWWLSRTTSFSNYFEGVADQDEARKVASQSSIALSNQGGADLFVGILSDISVSDILAQSTTAASALTYAGDLLATAETAESKNQQIQAKVNTGSFLQVITTYAEIEEETEEQTILLEADSGNDSSDPETSTEPESTPPSESEIIDAPTELTPESQAVTDGADQPTAAATTTTTATTTTSSGSTATDTATITTETTVVAEINFPFPDVSEAHDYEAIADIKARGIVGGYDDGTYRPDNPINRAEFTKIVVGAVVESPTGASCFPDVNEEWFAPFVCTAQEQGIVGGYPDGTFQPANEVNLAEAYKIIGETLFPGEAVPTEVWYQAYVNLGSDKGFYLGVDVALDAAVTRNQMATMISKALFTKEATE